MIELENAVVYHGSNLDVLPTLPDNSVDAIVTDPPYELGFMGKSWDSSGIAYSVELWQECLRVLKPGGHLLAFGGSRTWHRIAVAIEDAGFDVRDSIAWLYGSGFPKSLDVSKAIDKAAGAEREVIGQQTYYGAAAQDWSEKSGKLYAANTSSVGIPPKEVDITAPATEEAKKWQGWGTALKPAFEPVVVARKPLVGTVAANVLQWGVGGLNIDGSRIGTETVGWQGAGRNGETATAGASQGGEQGGYNYGTGDARPVQGRWPANIILDEYTAGLLDEQSGVSKSPKETKTAANNGSQGGLYDLGFGGADSRIIQGHGDSGGASRFFYVAKASKKDRNEGLEDLPEIQTTGGGGLTAELNEDGFLRTDSAGGKFGSVKAAKQNFHPTVKPTALMEYLVKLVTPPGGTVLDPFTGSGSTGKAALLNGFKFIGIELTADYLPIIEGRLKHAAETYAAKATEEETKEQETLF